MTNLSRKLVDDPVLYSRETGYMDSIRHMDFGTFYLYMPDVLDIHCVSDIVHLSKSKMVIKFVID